jgi:glycosidase
VIYYGEELGMRGSRGGENTDANRRLAMLWGNDDVRNPAGSTYPADKQIQSTVQTQKQDPNSMLMYYNKLLSIRHRNPAIARGIYTALDCGEKNLGGFRIEYKDQVLGLLHNTSLEEMSIDLSTLSGCNFTKLLEVIGCGNATLRGSVLTLAAQTSVILQ